VNVRSGWAELVDPAGHEAVARGCVFVIDPPLPCPLEGHWIGELRFLRGVERLRGRPNVWLLRFEGGTQHRWVELASVERTWTHVGERATARLVSSDDLFPSGVIELGGDA
jgi:hypothetical protein